MIRLIVCDLDETLVDKNRLISAGNQEAIAKAIKQGCQFAIATGRGYSSTLKVQQTLNTYEQADFYSITFNGAVLSENKNHRVIYQETLPFDLCTALFDIARAHDVGFQIYTFDSTYIYNLNDDEREYIKTFPNLVELTEPSIAFLQNQSVYKCLFQSHDTAYLEAIYEQIPSEIKSRSSTVFSSGRYMEFVAHTVSKGHALRILSDYLKIPLSDVLAIGDNHNDLSMLKESGYCATVANGLPSVKAVADYISPQNHNQSPVADILKHFEII